MTATALRATVITRLDHPALSPEVWDRVLARSPRHSVFQTWAWNRVWWESFERGELLIVVVEDATDVRAIAPLFVDGGMAFLVGSGGSDYLDLIGEVDAPGMVETVLDYVRAVVPGLLGLHLYHVPDASPTGALLRAAAARLGLECHDEGLLPAPRLSGGPPALETAAFKKSLVRHERALRRSGSLQVKRLAGAEALGYLETFFDQHVRRWAGRESPSLFIEPSQRTFYRNLISSPEAREWLRFIALLRDGAPVAFHLGMSYGREYLWYKPSFEIELSHLSPGEVLLRSLLLDAAAEDCDVFDFGLGDEAFKLRFATETPLVTNWGLYPRAGETRS